MIIDWNCILQTGKFMLLILCNDGYGKTTTSAIPIWLVLSMSSFWFHGSKFNRSDNFLMFFSCLAHHYLLATEKIKESFWSDIRIVISFILRTTIWSLCPVLQSCIQENKPFMYKINRWMIGSQKRHAIKEFSSKRITWNANRQCVWLSGGADFSMM